MSLIASVNSSRFKSSDFSFSDRGQIRKNLSFLNLAFACPNLKHPQRVKPHKLHFPDRFLQAQNDPQGSLLSRTVLCLNLAPNRTKTITTGDLQAQPEIVKRLLIESLMQQGTGIKKLLIADRSLYETALLGSPIERLGGLVIKRHKNFTLEICRGFVTWLRDYFAHIEKVKPAEFDHVFGQEFFFSAPSAQDSAENHLNFAVHIARALNLFKLHEKDTVQNLRAIAYFDLSRSTHPAFLKAKQSLKPFIQQRLISKAQTRIRRHFNVQKTTINDMTAATTSLSIKALRTGAFTLDSDLHSVPPHLGKLIELERLAFHNHHLKTIPSLIFNLRALTLLDISNCEIESIPRQISLLENLEILNLCHNKITKIPPQIGKLIKLKVLGFSHNNIRTLPSEIGDLINLNQLNISHNSYLQVLPLSFKKLGQLHVLLFQNCAHPAFSTKEFFYQNSNVFTFLREKTPPCNVYRL